MDQLSDRDGAIRDGGGRDEAGRALAALTASGLAPFFRRPVRLGVSSAWYGHLPFASWIVQTARPRLIVELGTHAGVSYAAFCEAVLQDRLDARCYAIDTWQGDDHAGFYGEDVFAELRQFHDSRYAGFSRLIRCRFDEALPHFADGSIDLLHIDGRHRYDDVAHDFASWRPKLSARAVVLLHDTNVRERDFGVWRFWAELRERYPAFEFLHAHGLGVLAVGPDAPEPVVALCQQTESHEIGVLRERFGLLGERWALMQQLNELDGHLAAAEPLRRALAEHSAELAALRMKHAGLAADDRARMFQLAELRNRLAIANETVERLVTENTAFSGVAEAAAVAVADWQDRARRADENARNEAARAAAAEQDRLRTNDELAALTGSLAWRLTRPLRAAIRRMPGALRQPSSAVARLGAPTACLLAAPILLDEPTLAPAAAAPAVEPDQRPRVLFVSGEPATPGHYYRVERAMQAANAAGWRTEWSEVAPVGPHTLAGARLVVLWRVPWSPHMQGILDACKEIGARAIFDVDDLVFRPELARLDVIDGIRTTETTESAIGSFFAMINRALDKCELATCTTEELARHIRSMGGAAVVLPNGFDDAAHALSRKAARTRRQIDDRLVRIGYASGSRTHQRDFGLIVKPLAAVLRARPDTRLTVFRDPRSDEGVVLLHEFPELVGLEAQIEWRDMVPLPVLPEEVARFAINLAPLEVENVFCEAKSELKYFEAALVDVPTVASPTGPMRRAIRHGETGFLAETEQEWQDTLLRLVDDPGLRRRTAQAAYHDALWRFGPRRREEAWLALLREFQGGAEGARAFELKLRRGEHAALGIPHVPQAETLFAADALGDAAVTVIVPLFNYAEYVLDALESVRSQTLDPIDLVVIDDGSTDDSIDLVQEWARRHATRFNRLIVKRHLANAGLGFARNSGFAAAETPFVLPLDADNRLLPNCASVLAERLRASRAAFVYPSLQQFGDKAAVFGDTPYSPSRLVSGNYIDAMALVAKWAWAAAGGYDHVRYGWEDYDFWCRLIELGLGGEHVAEVLAEYRVHKASMLARSTDVAGNKLRLIDDMGQRHPWLRLPHPG